MTSQPSLLKASRDPTTAMMRAVVADQLGPPENYHFVDIPKPVPGPEQVRIRVGAVSIGYADVLQAAGRYQIKPPTPFVPCTEVAGVVDAVGAGVTGYTVGQRVTGNANGGAFAEFMVAHRSTVHALPDRVSLAEGSSFRTNFATTLYALKDRGQLRVGETLLVLGAAGGCGISAVQMGCVMGARVVAGASSAAKRAFALAHGADVVIDYSRADWRRELKERVPAGIDVVYDPVGGNLLEPAFRSLRWGGRHLVIGFAAGTIPALPANLALLKGAALVGVDYGQFLGKEPAAAAEIHRLLSAMLEAGKLRPVVGPVFEFADFRRAMVAASDGSAIGKVVLRVAADLS